MSEYSQILSKLDELQTALNNLKVTAQQVALQEGLSDLSERLGLIQSGEFRAGNSKEPGGGFSGVRMGYPPFTYESSLWNLVGIANDVLQFGLSASDGKAYFGAGTNIMDQYGLHVYDASDKPALIALSDAETINGESLGAGDVLIGDNSTGKPNILWDNSDATLYFRVATTAFNKMSTGSFQTITAQAARAATQSFTTGTPANLQFDTETLDDNGFISLGTDNTKITVATGYGGTYTIGFNYSFTSNATGFRAGAVKKNGTIIAGDTRNAVNGTDTAGFASVITTLAAGDYLQLELTQTSGGNLNGIGVLWIKKDR